MKNCNNEPTVHSKCSTTTSCGILNYNDNEYINVRYKYDR